MTRAVRDNVTHNWNIQGRICLRILFENRDPGEPRKEPWRGREGIPETLQAFKRDQLRELFLVHHEFLNTRQFCISELQYGSSRICEPSSSPALAAC
jgi:hypothetical protein